MYNFTAEEKLEVCADIAGAFFDIFEDKDVIEAQKKGKSRRALVEAIMKNHSKEVIEIMARVQTKEGISTKEYLTKTGIVSIPIQFLQVLNDPMISGLFNAQGQPMDETSSGSATENTEVGAK